MKRAYLTLLICLASCHRYADFQLPEPHGPARAAWPVFHEEPAPVLTRDGATDVLNPSVVAAHGELWNFYSEYDGHTWHTALARSKDGRTWSKLGRILSPDTHTWEGSYIAANGAAAFDGKRWLYWYVAGPEDHPSIGLATGSEPGRLQKQSEPVLKTGPRGSFDEMAVADPYAIRVGEYWYLYYLGQDRARRQQIGLARSRDGVAWEKLRANPVLATSEPGGVDDRGLGEPAVWEADGWYWMLFTGRDARENRSLGLARSRDGVKWERSTAVYRGTQPWDAKVICDPTVVVDTSGVNVWFGGGDIGSPDQNLHGQIGHGNLANLP